LEFPAADARVIAVSTFLFVSAKIRSKDRLIVSVKT
jgi:prefoldin subunit 5